MNEKEIWKPIPDFPDYYISNYGRIKSYKFNKPNILSTRVNNKSGYTQISLCKNNKRTWVLIHRMVLSAFNPVENMDELEVNHKDENKLNNHLDNLEWVTRKENLNYGTRNLRSSQKREIKILCVEKQKVYDSFHKAAKELNIDVGSINMCCTGYRNRKTAGGYHWRYYNEQEE